MRNMIALLVGVAGFGAWAQESFVNYETAHVSPLALSPNGLVLAACNTADNRIELFDTSTGVPIAMESIPVGLDPVSVRFRTNGELWVVNQISDSVSVIDLRTGHVRATIQTNDEPADVIFAGNPERAFVSCSQTAELLVFDPNNLDQDPEIIPLAEDAPRALAVSPDRSTVYVAFFESGNSTSIEGSAEDLTLWPWASSGVDSPLTTYNGENPPLQLEVDIDDFLPIIPETPGLRPWPRSSLVMTFGDGHDWQDGSGLAFADLISGTNAPETGRVQGWARTDYGIAVVDANALTVSYVKNLNTMNMSMAVNPITGVVSVSGLRAHNYVRFEPSVAGTFTQINIFYFNPATGSTRNSRGQRWHKVNDHIARFDHRLPQAMRDRSIGDPRGMAWREDGEIVYMAGMGSNNIVTMDGEGQRAGVGEPFTIEVGEGPTGLAVDGARNRLYVLNRFEATISVVDTGTERELQRIPFFDPTPESIRVGRRHFYDTHETSGTGMVSCATCHVDGKSDKFSWNLGDPGGDLKALPVDANPGGNLPGLADNLEAWHPVKGDMMTQTLQDIIGKEPLHWRGDRTGIEEFNPAFVGLLGTDEMLTDQEMAEFKAFLASITFPPNPARNLDNTLPNNLSLPGLLTAGVFGPEGQPMPNGDATRGLELFRTRPLGHDASLRCVSCHTLPTGMGTNALLIDGAWQPIPIGPDGETHHALVSNTGSSQTTFKVPHLRSVREKIGFDLLASESRKGFGFMHDGSVDTLPRLLSAGHFSIAQSVQDVADLAAFLIAFTGSDFEVRAAEPPGTPSQDSHTAVGRQVTLTSSENRKSLQAVDELVALSEHQRIELTLRYRSGGLSRGAVYMGAGIFKTDRADELLSRSDLISMVAPGNEQTYTLVVAGTETRIALDRDEDGLYDNDEARMLGQSANPFNSADADATGDNGSSEPDGLSDGENDFDGDGVSNATEFAAGTNPLVVESSSVGGCGAGPGGLPWSSGDVAITLLLVGVMLRHRASRIRIET